MFLLQVKQQPLLLLYNSEFLSIYKVQKAMTSESCLVLFPLLDQIPF